ncbi:MAG: serine/threonine protein kinase [Myxococcales bacterium]|nr:serine/threonine protein kinase [Myxococcales bacterium]
MIASKYRVDRVLGEGAMGVVVAATHADLGTQVAVKFMLPAALTGADSVERFLREARAASRLRSEHVCRVLDVGRLEHGAPYIVMEMLDGRDVQATLDSAGVLSVGVAASYVTQVCEAIGEAHAAGIVHRDLKPQNLFVTRKVNGAEAVKVLDFGISKVAGGADAVRTHHAAIMGTPAYMSPEQCQASAHVDGRTDIWALGVILYQLATGRLPFDGADFLQIAMAVTNTHPVPPTALRPDLPAGFDAVVMRCLEKDRDRRFASAQELAAALQPFVVVAAAPAPAAWSQATRVAAGTGAGAGPVTTLGGAAGTASGGAAPRRRTGLAIALGGVVVVGGLVYVLTLGGGKNRPAATVAPAGPTSATQPAPPAEAPAAVPSPTPAPSPAEISPAVAPPAAPAVPAVATEPPAAAGSAGSRPSVDRAATTKQATSKPGASKATDLHVGTLTADVVKADRIKAKKIEADEIEAKRIEAERIKAGTIEVKDEDVFKK